MQDILLIGYSLFKTKKWKIEKYSVCLIFKTDFKV